MRARKSVIAMVVLMPAIVGFLAPQAVVADDAYYQIKVSAGPDEDSLARLKLFYQRLLIELKVDDLGYVNVGCDKCGKLGEGPPEVKLTFALERDGLNLPAFLLSYHYVQLNMGHDLFSMTIDGTPPPSAVCPNPVPQGCRNRPICNMYDGCDKPYGGPCAPCQ